MVFTLTWEQSRLKWPPIFFSPVFIRNTMVSTKRSLNIWVSFYFRVCQCEFAKGAPFIFCRDYSTSSNSKSFAVLCCIRLNWHLGEARVGTNTLDYRPSSEARIKISISQGFFSVKAVDQLDICGLRPWCSFHNSWQNVFCQADISLNMEKESVVSKIT